MRWVRTPVATLATASLVALSATLFARQNPAPAPAAGAPAAGRAGGAGQGRGTRLGLGEALDPAAVERGRQIYPSNCGFCHGADARGAQGPELLRSLYVLSDEGGRQLGEFLKVGRPATGMPAFATLTDAQSADLAAFLKSLAAANTGRGRGAPADPMAVVVGNATAGQAYFNGEGRCNTCHSPTGNLRGVGSKYTPMVLQGRMINPRVVVGRGAPLPPPIRATIALPGGQTASGNVVSVNDFFITIVDAAGSRRTFARDNDVPKVVIDDPLAAHRELMLKYTDKNMHDLLAYLVTLK